MIWLWLASLYLSTVIVVVAIMFSVIIGWRWWQPPMKLRIKFPALDKLCCLGGLHRVVVLCRRGCCTECIRCEAEKAGKLTEHYTLVNKALKAAHE